MQRLRHRCCARSMALLALLCAVLRAVARRSTRSFSQNHRDSFGMSSFSRFSSRPQRTNSQPLPTFVTRRSQRRGNHRHPRRRMLSGRGRAIVTCSSAENAAFEAPRTATPFGLPAYGGSGLVRAFLPGDTLHSSVLARGCSVAPVRIPLHHELRHPDKPV